LFIYTNKREVLLEDLYKLIYQQQNNYGYSFFLAYAIKIHLFLSILGKQCVPKAPAVGTMLLSGLCLKWIV
jgi:hypothetical protein